MIGPASNQSRACVTHVEARAAPKPPDEGGADGGGGLKEHSSTPQ
jgi:hypothetical protein